MTSFPQLRIRTEFSFRNTFGPIQVIANHLAEINCKTAAIVDSGGTWGHVRWEKALTKLNIQSAFGAEFALQIGEHKPTAWCLAENIANFYRFTSSQPKLPEHFGEAPPGVIRFCGAALNDPDTFDYIDLNPTSIRRARNAVALAESAGKPLVLTSDNNYPALGDRDKFLAITDNKKMTPQHILHDYDELRKAFFFLPDEYFEIAFKNTFEVAERLQGIKLRQAPLIHVEGDFGALVEAGRLYRLEKGHISAWNTLYQRRLERELELIAAKDFASYFIVVADLVCWAKERMLVGPARGSSAGSLVCYLLRITEVDPLIHGLLFERFIDINRNDLPDIDIDFNDKKRELCFEYLEQKYGKDNIARIGNVNTLKPKSVLIEAGKRLGIPASATFAIRNVLIEPASGDARYGKGLEDTFTQTQPGKDFCEKFPEAKIIAEVENHAWHSSVHAAGIIVSNVAITEYCTVKEGIAQIDKPDAEYLNLLKIDVLGLRTLGIIEDSGCITAEELYQFTFEDKKVFDILNNSRFSGVFQFEGAAQRRISSQVPINAFKQIDHVTALARPGPMGGGATERYIKRNAGQESAIYKHPMLAEFLNDTYGVIVYQEQVMQIIREIGGFNWGDTSIVRKGISQSKGGEFINKYRQQFIEGAAKNGVTEEIAKSIWNEIYSFGAYGMNRSHTCSYAMISYYCCYMKAYHPLEYAAACLRSAKDDEQVIEILRELAKEGVGFIPFDPWLSDINWSAKEGKLLGGYTNLFGIGLAKANVYIQKRNAQKLTEKDLEKLKTLRLRNSELRPAHALYNDIYLNPDKYNVHGYVREFAYLEEGENAVILCRIIRKERRDENEAKRVERRDGERFKGQSLFLDMYVVDDSISQPVIARIRPDNWSELGKYIADKAIDNQDWFLVRGRWLAQFSMMIVKKIKCLTNPEMFNAQA